MTPTNPKETKMKQIKQVTRGPFRINLEKPEDGRSVYYEIRFAATDRGVPAAWSTMTATEIVFVGSSRIAFNNAVRKYGRALLDITNLETGQLVVGGK